MSTSSREIESKKQVYEKIFEVLTRIFGKKPGYRYVHAKGIICQGRFFPSIYASSLSRAQIFKLPSTPLIIRFSNFTGIPDIPDNDPNASPRGMAVRFTLPDGDIHDIVAHSYNGFPASTMEEFLQFLQALASSPPDARKPTPLENFLAEHPQAYKFANDPKPVPAGFAAQSYYGVDALLFANSEGKATPVRYRIQPVAGERHLDSGEAAKKQIDFLFDELRECLGHGSALFRLMAQIPDKGDPIADPAATWPDDRQKLELGIIAVDRIHKDSDSIQRTLAFDPANLVDGVDISGDGLPRERSMLYAMAFENRNK